MVKIIEVYRSLAISYNVNPLIFIGIYVLFTPSYYFGVYVLGRSGLNYHKHSKRTNSKMSIKGLLLQKGFLEGYFINRASWAAPYIYVIIFGENLTFRFYLLLILWIALGTLIFSHNLIDKYFKRKNEKELLFTTN